MTISLPQDLNLNWASTEDDIIITKRIKDCLDRTNWAALCEVASRVRNAGQHCTPHPVYTIGGTKLARLLRFEDGTCWVVRVQQQPKPSTPETSRRIQQAEVDTVSLLRTRTKTPVPQIFAWETGDDNPVGVPFVLLELLPGNTAMEEAGGYEIPDGGLIPLQFRRTFYGAVATAHVQIASARLPQIGTVVRAADGSFTVGPITGIGGPFDTAASFVQAWATHVKSPFNEHYLRKIVPTPLEITAEGPFPMRHADFWHSSVVVTKAFDLLGIIDWEGACSVPWELVDAPQFLHTVPARLLGRAGEERYDGETGEPLEKDEIRRWAEKRAYAEMVRRAEEDAGTDHRLSDVLSGWDEQDLAATFHLFGDGKVGTYGRVLDYLENR